MDTSTKIFRHIGAFAAIMLMAGCSSPLQEQGGIQSAQSNPSLPSPGTVVPFSKVMNPSFIRDYKNCDIVVEAKFLKLGLPPNFILGRYDIKANTVFQIVEPGSEPTNVGGMTIGNFAGIPKSQSALLFDLKPGETILLRGAPIEYPYGESVFQATSVNRK